MSKTRIAVCGLVTVGVLGCTPPTQGPVTPKALPDTFVKYERMALLYNGDGNARFRGFDGAAPQGALIQVYNSDTQQKVRDVTPDADGRWDILVPGGLNQQFTIVPVNGGATAPSQDFRARNPVDVLRQSIIPRIAGTGSTPNQVITAVDAPARGATRAYVVLSGDNAVDNLDWEHGTRPGPLVVLPDAPGPFGPLPAAPWSMVARGTTGWVSLYSQARIAVVDLDGGNVRATTSPLAAQPLPAAVSLNPPGDADGDGTAEDTATAVMPRNPTGVTVVGDRVFVAFATVLSNVSSGAAQYAPGMLVSYRVGADGTPTGEVRTAFTSYLNPQHLVPHPDGAHVIVSGTGALQRDAAGWHTSTPGGVDVFDAATLALSQSFNLADFGPSRALPLPDGHSLYVPSILRARLARLDLDTGAIVYGPGGTHDAIKLEDTDALRTVFECALHLTGLVFCGVFDSDSLLVIDSRDDAVRPFPFINGLNLSELSNNLRLGVQSVAIRPGRNGVDHVGADIFVLLSLASRLAAVDTRIILGP